MSTFVQGGKFTVGALGPLVVAGLGFSPKAILFHAGGAGLVDNPRFNSWGTIGMTDGVSTYSHAWGKNNANAPNYRRASDAALIRINNTGTIIMSISVASLDADGFTLNVDVFDISSQAPTEITFTAFGGDTLKAKVGSFTPTGVLGDQVVAGVGFESSLVFLSHSSTPVNSSQSSAAQGNLGITIKNTRTGVINAGVSAFRAYNTSVARSLQIASSTCTVGANGGGTEQAGIINAMGPDGFTINWTVAGNAFPIEYLCMSGFADLHLRENTPIGALGPQSVTGVGFKPDSVFFTCCNAPSSQNFTVGGQLATGWSNAVGHFASATSMADGATNSVYSAVSYIKSLYAITENIGYSTFIVTSLDFDGYTINNQYSGNRAHYALSIRNDKPVAVEVVQAFCAEGDGGVPVAIPSPTRAGSTLLVFGSNATYQPVTPPVGFTEIASNTDHDAVQTYAWIRVNAPVTSSITVGWNGLGSKTMGFVELSGCGGYELATSDSNNSTSLPRCGPSGLMINDNNYLIANFYTANSDIVDDAYDPDFATRIAVHNDFQKSWIIAAQLSSAASIEPVTSVSNGPSPHAAIAVYLTLAEEKEAGGALFMAGD